MVSDSLSLYCGSVELTAWCGSFRGRKVAVPQYREEDISNKAFFFIYVKFSENQFGWMGDLKDLLFFFFNTF